MNYVIPEPRRSLRATTADGVEIGIAEWGNPDGRAIVFVHGICQSLLSFAAQVNSALAEEFRLIAYDLRGHGDSDKPEDPIFYSEGKRWGDELATVIEATGAERPVIVGWSLGGRVVGQYLIHHGLSGVGAVNFVSARVLADSVYSGPAIYKPSDAGGTVLGRRILTAAALLEGCYEVQPPADEFCFALGYNLATPTYVLGGLSGMPAEIEENKAMLRALSVPTLITHGGKDRVVLPTCAQMVASLVPGARLSIFEDYGHSPFREDAPRFNGELADLARAVN